MIQDAKIRTLQRNQKRGNQASTQAHELATPPQQRRQKHTRVEVIAMSEEAMTTITLEFDDGTTEDIELPTTQYQQITQYCKEENITLDEYIERAVDHYSLELDFRELLLQIEELEEKNVGHLDELHSLKEKVRSVMTDPDWRQ